MGYVQCNDTEGFGECLMCTGEACNKCGAGCWSHPINTPPCEHGVMERHEEADTSPPPIRRGSK